MCPGIAVAGGGGGAGGGSGGSAKKGKGKKGAGTKKKKKGAQGGKKSAKAGKKKGKDKSTCGGAEGKCPGKHGGGKKKGRGDPVDVTSGRVFTEEREDLFLPGALPLRWHRTYSSAMRDRDVGMGYGWSHTYGVELEVVRKRVTVWNGDGTLDEFELPDVGAVTLGEDALLLQREPWGFILDPDTDVRLIFSASVDSGRRWLLTAVQDRNGHRIELYYDDGVLVQVIDSAKRVVDVGRGRDGRIASLTVRTRDGQSWPMRSYEYGSDGDLIRTTNADGHSEWFEYEAHRLTKWKDSTGIAYHFRYDAAGRCFETWGDYDGQPIEGLSPDVPALLADGETPAKGFNHVRIHFYTEGWSEVADSVLVQRYDANEEGWLEKSVTGSAVFTRQFDDNGYLLSLTYPSGHSETWTRDARGRALEHVDVLGRKRIWEYDTAGRVVRAQTRGGTEFRYEYDLHGNATLIEGPLGHVWTCQYTNGFLTRRVGWNGEVLEGRWDADGNLVTLVESDGARWTATYDSLGRQTSLTDPFGATTIFGYTAMGALESVQYPDGTWARLVIDGARQLLEVAASDGRRIQQIGGLHRQLVARIDADGLITRFRYDRENRLVQIENPAGETHEYEYDANNFLRREKTFDGRTLRYRYDLQGTPARIEDGDLATTELVFDPATRLVQRRWSDGREDAIEYDIEDRLTKVETADTSVTWEHDAWGRVLRESQTSDGRTHATEHAYDLAGSYRRRTDLGLFQEIRYQPGRAITDVLLDRTRLGMRTDPCGRITDVELPHGGRIELGFDFLDRLQHLRVRRPVHTQAQPEFVGQDPGLTIDTSFHYGVWDEILEVHDLEGTTSFSYDAHVQLTEIRGTHPERFGHDRARNVYRVGEHRVYGEGGRVLEIGAERWSWDDAGRLVERATEAGTWHYEWSAAHELLKVNRPDGREVTLQYDAVGRLLLKTVRAGTSVETETRFVWADDQLLHIVSERAGAAPRVVSYAYLLDDFTPIADRVDDGDWRFFLPGAIPSAHRWVDSAGNRIGEVGATAYGQAVTDGDATPLRNPGQLWDDDCQMVYNRARWYEPSAGVYVSPDPIGIAGGLALYGYARNAPSMLVDPLGLAFASRTCVFDGSGKELGSGFSGRPGGKSSGKGLFDAKRKPPMTHHPKVEDGLAPAKEAYANGSCKLVHMPGDCSEPAAFNAALKDHGSEVLERPDTKIVTIQCRPNKTGKPAVGETKDPCKYCQKMLGKMNLNGKLCDDPGLRAKCLASGGNKCRP
jgi:RHS repeat-associated protein